MSLLADRAVVVTGAGRGLGRAYAEAAAAAGAAVVVNDVDAEAAEQTVSAIVSAGGSAVSCVAAVDAEDSGEALVAAALGAFGRVDGLVANAGVIVRGDAADERYADAERQLRVNVLGVVATSMAVFRSLRDRRRPGSIVLITSGTRAGWAGMATYGATKAAVASLAMSWAIEGAPYGIRANALSPVARTGMFPPPGDAISRPHEPEDIAPAVVYLLSELSRGITGQVIRFTGDALALSPSPVVTSAEITGSGWTAESIAAAIRGPLASGLAPVGAGMELTVPFE